MKVPTGPCEVLCAGAAAHLLLPGMGPTIAAQLSLPADQAWPGNRTPLGEHSSRSWRVTSPVPVAPGVQQQSRSESLCQTLASSLASSRLVPVARLPRPLLGSGSSSASDGHGRGSQQRLLVAPAVSGRVPSRACPHLSLRAALRVHGGPPAASAPTRPQASSLSLGPPPPPLRVPAPHSGSAYVSSGARGCFRRALVPGSCSASTRITMHGPNKREVGTIITTAPISHVKREK